MSKIETPSLENMLAQHAALAAQIEEMKKVQRDSALADALKTIALFDFAVDDLFPTVRVRKGYTLRASGAPKTRAPVAPKYRDPESGATWSGRGKPPKWIADKKDRSQFGV